MNFQEGELVYLRYIGDPDVVHTRLLLGHIEADEWMICTPDRDVYVEELHARNADLAHLWHAPDNPAGCRGESLQHRFTHLPLCRLQSTRASFGMDASRWQQSATGVDWMGFPRRPLEWEAVSHQPVVQGER